MLGPQSADLAGAEPAGVHQREERGRLPSPWGLGFECPRRVEEQRDLTLGEQVGVSGDERGFPVAGEHVRVGGPVRAQPPAEVTGI